MENTYKSFEDLCSRRKKWLIDSKQEGMYEGFKNLLTDLYPDRVHFLFELLQNAEDTRATEVTFLLKNNELFFCS